MERKNAMTDTFEKVSLYGKDVLFTDLRIDRKTVPDGIFQYEVRHADDDWGDPVQLAQGILVNHFGTILSREPIALDKDGYRRIAERDFSYKDSGSLTLADFMAEQPEQTHEQTRKPPTAQKKRQEPER